MDHVLGVLRAGMGPLLMVGLALVALGIGPAASAGASGRGFTSGPVLDVDEARAVLRPPDAPWATAQVVGGAPAAEGRWPAVVSVNLVAELDGGNDVAGHFCGGTLIAASWILTAAHCLTEPTADGGEQRLVPPELLEVIVGRTRLSSSEGARHRITALYVADEWRSGETSHDIGLIELATPSTVTPVSLLGPLNESSTPPSSGATSLDGTVWAVGWGSTLPHPPQAQSADRLHEAVVRLWSLRLCEQSDRTFAATAAVCAGPQAGDPAADACYGDSGGPLMRLDRRTGLWRQLAIVSRAVSTGVDACGVPGQPTIYTHVAAFADQLAAVSGVAFTEDPPPLPPATVVAGETRYGTSVAASQAAYPEGAPHAGPEEVVVARGTSFGDALAGAPAAAVRGGPLLLVPSDRLPGAVVTEIERLAPARITLIGGEDAVSAAVGDELAALVDGRFERIQGASRYDTAIEISRRTFTPGVEAAFIATGADFADALTGAVAAAGRGGPLLLVPPIDAPDADRAVQAAIGELRRLEPDRVVLLGGHAAVAPATAAAIDDALDVPVERLGGEDRFATAAAVAKQAPASGLVYLATGASYPDALSATTLAATAPGPLLLVRGSVLPMSVRAVIREIAPDEVRIVGGPTAVSPVVVEQFGP